MPPARFNSGQVSDWGRTPVIPASNLWTRYYKSGTRQYNLAPGVNTNSAGNANSARVNRWWIWAVDRYSIVTIRVNVTTLESGATVRVGTYNLNDDLEPTTLIEDYGTMDCSTTGAKTIVGTIPVSGRFAVAAAVSNHSTVRFTRAASSIAEGHFLFGDLTAYNGNYGYCWGVDSVDYSAGLPATAPAVTIQGVTTNLIMPAVSFS